MIPTQPKGIGGWLLLLALIILGLPGRIAVQVAKSSAAFSNPELVLLIQKESSSYEWAWAALYVLESPMSSVLFFFAMCLIPTFFLKHRKLPILFAVFATMCVSMNLARFALSYFAPGITPEYQHSINIQATFGSAALVFWTLYLFKSRRARYTFKKVFGFTPFLPFFRTYEVED